MRGALSPFVTSCDRRAGRCRTPLRAARWRVDSKKSRPPGGQPRRKPMPRIQRSLLAAAFTLAALVGAAAPSEAQNWPQRPVRFLVTLGAGSGIDIGTRLLADRLTKRWNQPVVVENRPGGDAL